MGATGDQTGEMRHIDHEIGPDLVGDRTELREIDDARIGRTAGNDQARLMLQRQATHVVIIDQVRIGGHAILDGLEPLAGLVDRGAVGQMAAGGERHAHDRIAWLQQRLEHGLVRLRARVGLHVRKLAVEQALGALDRQRLGHVDIFAAAVVALARVAFGILVGQDGTLGLEHRARNDVLRRDQFDLVTLATQLVGDAAEQLGVGLGQTGGEEGVRMSTGGELLQGHEIEPSLGITVERALSGEIEGFGAVQVSRTAAPAPRLTGRLDTTCCGTPVVRPKKRGCARST